MYHYRWCRLKGLTARIFSLFLLQDDEEPPPVSGGVEDLAVVDDGEDVEVGGRRKFVLKNDGKVNAHRLDG